MLLNPLYAYEFLPLLLLDIDNGVLKYTTMIKNLFASLILSVLF